jgi:DNA polymerase-3 subunit epsilon
MPRKGDSTEQIVTKLRQAEIELGRGLRTRQVCKKVEVSEQAYCRWRSEAMAIMGQAGGPTPTTRLLDQYSHVAVTSVTHSMTYLLAASWHADRGAISYSCALPPENRSMNVERLAQELATHLALTRPLVCLDLEATGVWAERDRIVQMATASIFPDGHVATWSSYVNPEQPIPPATIAIHGITDAMVALAPTFAQLAPIICDLVSGADLAGFNIARFDRRLLAAECRRAGWADPMADARVIDAGTLFVRQEPRSLEAALRFYGVETDPTTRRPHEANSDVADTLAVLMAQLKAYPEVPKTVDGLHDWLYPNDPNRIDADGKLVWREGVATIAFGQQAGTPLVDLAVDNRGFLEWVLRKDFSDEVKAIVRDALAGRFPARNEN